MRTRTRTGILGFLVALMLVGALVVLAGQESHRGSCRGILVASGDDLEAAVRSAPASATLCISGLHRISQPLAPKAGMTLSGDGSAVLDGGILLSDFAARDGRYVFRGQARNPTRQTGRQCTNYPLNCLNEGVYFDGRALIHVPASQLRPGTYATDYANDEVILADDPTGHSVEETNAPVVVRSYAPRVTLTNLVVQHAAKRGIVAGGRGWRIINVESRWNHTDGIRTDGDHYVIDGGHVHDNGQYGFTGKGSWGVIEGVESDHNDQLRFGTSLVNGAACWDAGESKWIRTVGMIVRDNYVHDGYCNGFWFDLDNRNNIVRDNHFEHNAGIGLIQETTQDGLVTGNEFVDSGYYDLELASSSTIEVHHNRFLGRGVLLVQQARNGAVRTAPCAAGTSARCPRLAARSRVWANSFRCVSICVAIKTGGIEAFWDNGNEFFDNRYATGVEDPAHWQIDASPQSLQMWRARGFDEESIVTPPTGF